MRSGLRLCVSVCALALAFRSSAALAQFNPDGTPSMIPPSGDVFNNGAAAPAPAPDYNGPIYQEGADGQPTEDFTVDCDPDIQNCVDPNADSQYDDGYNPQAYQQFQDTLAPYGQWSDDPDYGEVWTPSQDVVGNDFEPYASDGQWQASSDYGMVWVSDYEWGWAPFHYGRWILGMWGWMWVPGTLWGPAWVDWRYGNGYCGWAPMPPRGVVQAPPSHSAPSSHIPWHFTLASDVTRRNPSYVPATVAANVWKRTSPVTTAKTITNNGVSTKIAVGPSATQLSHDIGRTVPTMSLRNSAPSVLPRQSIVGKAGIALQQRGYVQHPPRVVGANAVPRSSMPSTSMPTVHGRNVSLPHQPVRSFDNGSVPSTVHNAYTNNNSSVPTMRNSYNNQNYTGEHSYSGYTPSAPVRTQPTYQQPTYQQPVYNQEWHSEPARAQPTYQQPTYQQPTYHSEPVRAQPTYQQPTYQQPVYHAEPVRSEPVFHTAPAPAAPVHTPTFSSPGTHRR